MINNYLKFAWRHIRKSPGYSFINIAGLAIGIASVLLIFMYIQHELSFDDYHKNKDRIYRITSYSGFNEKSWRAATPGDPVREFRNNYSAIEDGVRLMNCGAGTIKVDGDDYTDIKTSCTESNLFNVFSFPLLTKSREDLLEVPYTAVISRSTAKKIFGEVNPVGRTFEMPWGSQGDTETFEITGIMEDIPVNTHFRHDIYLSLASLETTGRCMDCGGQSQYLLLNEEADTTLLAENILNHVREIDGKNYVEDIALQSLNEIHFSSLHAPRKGDWQYIQILSAIAFIILIIGCANYMNMATARYSKRAREIGIRKVLGAYRSQLARQFLTETMLLTFIALPFAIFLLYQIIPWFNIYATTEVSLSLINHHWFYLALAGVLIITGLLAGSYPSLFISAFEPREVLQGNKIMGSGAAGIRKGLVTFQFMASLVMIGITVLIFQQLDYVKQKNLGFESDQVVSITVNDPALQQQPQTVKEEFARMATVQATTASRAPAAGGFAGVGFVFEPDTASDQKLTLTTPRIDEDFLETFKIKLKAGRNISSPTSENSERERISEALINTKGLQALGYDSPGSILNETVGNRYQIVGVVDDFHLESLQHEIEPAMLVRNPFGRAYVVNVRLAGGNISRGLDDLREAWSKLGATSPLDYKFVNDQLQQQYKNEHQTARVIGSFAILSIVIACMGLFGMASYTVQQRYREIGIRKVLGATVRNIVILLYKDFAKLIVLATLISIPVIYYAGTQWLENFAYRTNIGLPVFLVSVITVTVITLITTGYRSIQAALMNPLDSIRSE